VLSTFGNASGVARKEGLIVIKPSGVPYERMKPKDLVVTDLHGAKTRSSRAPVGDEKRGIFLTVGEIRWEKRASFTTADAQFVGVGDAQLDGVAIADATIAFTSSCSQVHSMPHTARAFETSVVKSSSLEKTAVIPHPRASFSISAPQSAMSKKIGNFGDIALSSRANCNPFISGREQSRTASFGNTCFVLRKASAAFSASTQTNPLPRSKRVRRIARKS
jgi:Class II Aldolase and Adducin N-terminal domain